MLARSEGIVAVYPGSFDPITLGHIDLIRRLAGFYREMIVLVAGSSAKTSLFTPEERKQLIKDSLGSLGNVEIETFSGLTVDFARSRGAQVIIRGLRAVADFEYEFAMANMNRRLAPEIETKIVFTRPEYSFISSRMVKEVAMYGGALTELVHPVVATALKDRIQQIQQGRNA